MRREAREGGDRNVTSSPSSPITRSIMNAVLDMVNGMVNFPAFVRLTKTEETYLMFTTSTDRELFNFN